MTSWAFALTTRSWKPRPSQYSTYWRAEAASFSGSERSSRSAKAWSSEPAFTPMRMGMPACPAASSTASVFAKPPMLPGLMRSFAAPRRAASMAMVASKCTSATTGKGDASHTAWNVSRQLRRGMAMRTTSHPASASCWICARLACASSAGALSMDCTTTGAPPPSATLPTCTWRVFWLGRIASCGNGQAADPEGAAAHALPMFSLVSIAAILPA